MPTRILREGIVTSERVNSLTFAAEIFYRRLMSIADDYGRYFAHPGILRAGCFPLLLSRVSEADVKQMLSECLAADLIVIYAEKYLFIRNFRQQTRGKSKFPEPSDIALLSKCEATVKQMRSESESESKTYADTGTESPVKQSGNGSIPIDETQAADWALIRGVPADFAIEIFNQCAGRNWLDGAGQQITSWSHYVKKRHQQSLREKKPAPKRAPPMDYCP